MNNLDPLVGQERRYQQGQAGVDHPSRNHTGRYARPIARCVKPKGELATVGSNYPTPRGMRIRGLKSHAFQSSEEVVK